MASKMIAFLVLLGLAATASADINTDVLNFALNLECLEAQYYSWAAYGKPISEALLGGGPPARGGKKAVGLTPRIQALAEDIAEDEIAHVAFLRTALGKAAVPCPLIDIGVAFAMAADFAFDKILPKELKFSPYTGILPFLFGAYIFEDVGVTAYHGAAGLLTNAAYLGPAAGILGTEAYHAGAVRELLINSANVVVPGYGVTVADITAAISKLRTNPGTMDDAGVLANGTSNLVPADANAITFARTPAQVLQVVYLGLKPYGGFFPKGLNGNVK